MSIMSIGFHPQETIRETHPTSIKEWYHLPSFVLNPAAKLTIEFHASDEYLQPGEVYFIYRTQLVLLSDSVKLWAHRYFQGQTSDWYNNNQIRVQYSPELESLYVKDGRELLLRCNKYAGEWRCNGYNGSILNDSEFFALNPKQVPQ